MGCCASRNESFRNEVPLSDTQILDIQTYRLQEGARQSVDLNVAGLQVHSLINCKSLEGLSRE